MKKKKVEERVYPSLIKSNFRFVRKFSYDSRLRILFADITGVENNKSFLEKLKDRFKFKRKEKVEEEKPAVDSSVERFNTNYEHGLTESQLEQRQNANLYNNTSVKSTKTYGSIFAKNIFTFFNMLWLIIAVALIAVGSYKDLIFIFVIVANTAIAIIQEIRAKIAVEKLSIVTTPMVKTMRGGKIIELPADQLVLDDVIILSSGNQIPSDSKILSGKVDVNESLLTGESNAIEKGQGDALLSGSFIVSGECYARVDKIGSDNYIHQMAKKAKEFKTPQSNLFKDLNRLIKYIGIALVPIGILTFFKELTITGSTIQQQITNTSGALTSMIPAGMFLLVTISLAIGVVKLSKKKTLVRDLYSIEMLARTNVLCLDKTGTITDGTMKVVDFMTYTNKRKNSVKKLLSNVLHVQKTTNSTSNAMIKEFGRSDEFRALNVAEFSSDRKFSITQLSNKKIYFLGAVTRIGCKLNDEQTKFIKDQQSKGYRILAFSELENASFDKKMSGKNSTLLALIVIEEHIREDAIETIQWFKDNGVEIKIISGDDPATVSKIAQRVGVKNSDKFVSLEGKSLKEVEIMADQFTVFGRVTPEQKYTIVKALKNKGKVVAMTGDGVNDTLALKEADCSIAMASGSEATRYVSHLVLMDSNFASMPKVVNEGRRVINNIQKSSALYLTKNLFAILLAIMYIIIGYVTLKQFGTNADILRRPFTAQYLILIETLIVGFASFALALQPNRDIVKGKFLPNVLREILPGALTILLFNMGLYFAKDITFKGEVVFGFLTNENVFLTIASIIDTLIMSLVLLNLCKPFNLYRKGVFAFTTILVLAAVILIPELAALEFSSFGATEWLMLIIIFLASYPVMRIVKYCLTVIRVLPKTKK